MKIALALLAILFAVPVFSQRPDALKKANITPLPRQYVVVEICGKPVSAEHGSTMFTLGKILNVHTAIWMKCKEQSAGIEVFSSPDASSATSQAATTLYQQLQKALPGEKVSQVVPQQATIGDEDSPYSLVTFEPRMIVVLVGTGVTTQ